MPRYEVPTTLRSLAIRFREPSPAVINGELIIFAGDGGLEAHRHADGSFVWKTALPPRTLGNVSEWRQVFSLAARGDALYAAGSFFPNWMGGEYEPTSSRLEVRTGQLEWDLWAGPSPLATASIARPSVVIDSSNQPVFGGFYRAGTDSTRGLTEQGAARWSSNSGPVGLAAAIGDRVFHSHQGWFDALGVMHPVPRFQNISFPQPLVTSAGVVIIGVSSPRIELMSEASGWQRVPLLDFVHWPPRATQPRVSAAGAVSFALGGNTNSGPALYDFAPDGRLLAACPFRVSPNESVDTSQPVVELVGRVVLVDNGRKVVWAFQR